jgi:hypothetical protein
MLTTAIGRTIMQTILQSPAEVLDQYKAFRVEGRLKQGVYVTVRDGRQIACALGVIGIKDARSCPASVMPRWLAQMVPWFFDRQRAEDAFAWGDRFYAELSRLDGSVPFSVIHDWHARFVGPMAVDVAAKRERDVAVHESLIETHKAALAGNPLSKDEWISVLRPAFKDADADADANAYADAYADADADAYAYADADAYAYAYAYADAYAYAVKILADGMVDCLLRVPSAEAR